MENNQFQLSFTTELNKGLTLTPLRQAFIQDDNQAHVFTVHTTRNGAANALIGSTIKGFFIPYGLDVTVELPGEVNADGAAVVSLTQDCYAFVGRFNLVIQAINGAAAASIFFSEGYVTKTRTDKVIEPSGASPSLGVLEERINNLTELAHNMRKPNLLDNSDFRNPVNQRGQASYVGAVYGIDRWRCWPESAVVTIQDGYISHEDVIAQYVPLMAKDKVYTLVVCNADGIVYTYTGKPESGAGTEALGLHYDANISCAYALISGYVRGIMWAALYEGAYTAGTLPAYQAKGYAAELAECQRYYRPYVETAPGLVITANAIQADMVLEPPMRITPTIINESRVTLYTTNGKVENVSGSYSGTNNPSRASYVFYSDTACAVGTPVVVTGIKAYLSADL